MEINQITAISPIDGRYADKTEPLRALFSEYGLHRHRLLVEIAWFRHLLALNPSLPKLSTNAEQFLKDIFRQFSVTDAQEIKDIEQTTNHDLKAVEYFLKKRLATHPELKPLSEWVHFACTSEDINNLAYARMIKTARDQCILPQLQEIIDFLRNIAHSYAEAAMLGRTHGQAASPTTLGKEMANFVARLQLQYAKLTSLVILGKFNGATGNFNAHYSAYPQLDWETVSSDFIEQFELTANPYTTQIEPHDYIAEFCHNLIRINNICIDLSRDIWGYIALDYFKQIPKGHEVGSSTMPHKINPIDFENAEGNFYLANALFDLLANRLPISRWQRDLTDSTLLRNLGVALSHTLIGLKGLLRGLKKLSVNLSALEGDLAQHWEVLSEAIQTVMRAHGIANPYEKLKAFTRGKAIDQTSLAAFIQDLDLPASAKADLLKLTPANYIGLAAKLAKAV